MLALLFGSLLGALCARLSGGLLPASFPAGLRELSLVRAWIPAAVFPCLLAAALLLRCRPLIRLLFFAKGAAAACTLCVFAASGHPGPAEAFLPLLAQTVLPLPLYLLMGSLRSDGRGEALPELLLLPPALGLSFLGVLLRSFL